MGIDEIFEVGVQIGQVFTLWFGHLSLGVGVAG